MAVSCVGVVCGAGSLLQQDVDLTDLRLKVTQIEDVRLSAAARVTTVPAVVPASTPLPSDLQSKVISRGRTPMRVNVATNLSQAKTPPLSPLGEPDIENAFGVSITLDESIGQLIRDLETLSHKSGECYFGQP